MHQESADKMANNVDTDQSCDVLSDHSLHCILRPIRKNLELLQFILKNNLNEYLNKKKC